MKKDNIITQKELQEKFQELIDDVAESSKAINEGFVKESVNKDSRHPLVRLSVEGKIDKLEKQKEIIEIQLARGDEFTYEDFLEFVEENTTDTDNYTSVSYYIGNNINDVNDMTDADKISNCITIESIDKNIEDLNLSLNLKHLKEKIRPSFMAISDSQVESKIKRSMKKINERYAREEETATMRALFIDLYGLREYLYGLAPAVRYKHNKFIYAFCKYTDAYFHANPFLVVETINNIKALEYGSTMEQNKTFIKRLNEVYMMFEKI